jgi:GTP-binding protein LepA
MDSQNQTRNFCIIAHIDHGKSTLADRLLEMTKTVTQREMKEQLLDQMDLERERGITIKLQPVRMNYEFEGQDYTLNLIDTPGHVDFSYEVSRSLAACEGAILVVDSTQGIEAQTLANAYLAIEHDLTLIPVVNKIDLPNSDRQKTAAELIKVFGFKEEEIIYTSGKTGEGVEDLILEIIRRVPKPTGDPSKPTRALIFDSIYDIHRGVIAFVRIVDGQISTNQKIFMMGSQTNAESLEVGNFRPRMEKSKELSTGSVGYIVTGLREVSKARVGDTVTLFEQRQKTNPLPGYQEVKPMVYAGIFPISGDDYPLLRDAASSTLCCRS